MRQFALALLSVCLLAIVTFAQPGRFSDRLTVQFKKPVVVSDALTLQPGTYTFQQLRSPANPNIFRVVDQTGQNIGDTAFASSAVYQSSNPNDVPGQTQVILKEVGQKRYLDRIWFAGQNRGYNFSLAENARNQQQPAVNSASSESGQTGKQNTANQVKEIVILAFVPREDETRAASVPDNSRGGSPNVYSAIGPDSSRAQSSSATGDSQSTQSPVSSSASAPRTDNSTITSNESSTQPSTTGAQQSMGDNESVMSKSNSNSSEDSLDKPNSGSQLVQVVGCVTSVNGDSYLLTKTGTKYQLRGDADNVREYAGRIVTVGGIVNPKTDNFNPTFIAVRDLAPTAELCDSASTSQSNSASMRGTQQNSAASSNNKTDSNPDSGTVGNSNNMSGDTSASGTNSNPGITSSSTNKGGSSNVGVNANSTSGGSTNVPQR